MNRLLHIRKRQKLVTSILLLSLGLFTVELFRGIQFVISAFLLAIFTVVLLIFVLRRDLQKVFNMPYFILPFLYSLSFALFYLLIPQRFVYRAILLALYTFGLYSLFLTQNIFAVSSNKTITLLRSARIVSFIITLLVLFFLLNIIFSLRFPIFITPLLVGIAVFLLDYQSLSLHNSDKQYSHEPFFYSFVIGLIIMELSMVILLWPVNASIFSLYLTGIYYTYSGLVHAWLEKRLFKGLLWEYVWVGFLSILILFLFAQWGL